MLVSLKSFLTSSDRSTLATWSRAKVRRPREARRAELLLLLDGGLSVRKVAAVVKINPNRVSHWKRRWEAQRFNGLADKARSGRKAKLTEEKMTEVLEIIKASPGQPALAYFAQKFKVSRMTVSRFLRQRQMRLALTVLERNDGAKKAPGRLVIASPLISLPKLPTDSGNDSQADILVRMMHEACDLHHEHHNYIEDDARFRKIITLAKQKDPWHSAALQAELNIMYLWHGINDLETSTTRAQALCDRLNYVKQDDPRLRAIALEAQVFRARICEQHQDFNGVFHWLEKANHDLNELCKASLPPGHMPKRAARIGHSFIIPHDCQIPISAYQATIAIFGGKSLVKQGLTWNRSEDVGRGLQLLKVAAKHDLRTQAWEDLGYDLLWQADAHYYFGDDSKVDRCFAMSKEHLTSTHGIGHYYLQRATFSLYHNRLAEYENFREKAIECFRKDFSWIGLAAVYGNDSLPHACYVHRQYAYQSAEEVEQRLKMAFVAAALEPSLMRLENLKARAGEWMQYHDNYKSSRPYAHRLAECVLNYENEFKAIRPIIRTDAELKLLKAGVAKATEALARSGGV
jgi:transposase